MLANAKVGDVVRFSYPQNHQVWPDRLIKVIGVRDMEKEPIRWKSKALRPHLRRSRYLIMGIQPDGTIRQFYCENVAQRARIMGWFGRLILWIRGYRFPAYAPAEGVV